MKPQEFRDIRNSLELSAQGMADALRIKSGRSIRYYESGQRTIAGRTELLMLIYKDYPLLVGDYKEKTNG